VIGRLAERSWQPMTIVGVLPKDSRELAGRFEKGFELERDRLLPTGD
jgi:hypothetical protein